MGYYYFSKINQGWVFDLLDKILVGTLKFHIGVYVLKYQLYSYSSLLLMCT